MDIKLELVPVPVTDVDKAIDFYANKAGFNLDHDFRVSESIRFVQITPPGSACSIVIGEGITQMKPGTQELQVVVADTQAAYDILKGKGVEVTDIENLPWGIFTRFKDPDGNTWSVQELVPQTDA